jgi:hypothetical protein
MEPAGPRLGRHASARIGFGVPNNTISRHAAAYATNSRFVAFLGTFARPAQEVWLLGNDLHGMDLFGDHTSTCTAHSGATKAHDWAVGVLGPLFRTAGHIVRSQHQVTASAGQRRGDVEIKSYLQDAAGHRSLVFDLSITHDRIGSSGHVQQNGLLSHPQDLDAPLRLAAK